MLPSTWDKKLIDMNVTQLEEKDLSWADMVMISAMTVQRESTQSVIKQAKKQGKLSSPADRFSPWNRTPFKKLIT
jgi:hypothetical protein